MPSYKLLDHVHSRATLNDGVVVWQREDLVNAVQDWINRLDTLNAHVIAFDLPNGLEWVALDLALLDSGRVAVPIPSFFSEQQRNHVIRSAGADVVIQSCKQVGGDLPGSADQIFRGTEIRIRRGHQAPTLHKDVALITYTSGSTGAPKGVCLSAATLIEIAQGLVETLRGVAIERHLAVLPLTLLLENTAGLFANLLNGSEIFVPQLNKLGIDGSSDLTLPEFIAGLDRFTPDSIILVPALLLGVVAAAEFGLSEFPYLEFVAVGGGRIARSLLERASSQNIPVYEGYGLTECGSVLSLNTPERRAMGTVGQLLPHVQAEVINEELVVHKPIMLGYLGETIGNTSVVNTGDKVAIDEDGFVTLSGRIKNTFITSFGRNVSPEWIESELQSEIAIAQASVFGEALPRNIAVIVARGEFGDSDVEQAVQQCNARLPDYARIGQWHRVSREEMHSIDGLTANGRPRRAEIYNAYQHLIITPLEN